MCSLCGKYAIGFALDGISMQVCARVHDGPECSMSRGNWPKIMSRAIAANARACDGVGRCMNHPTALRIVLVRLLVPEYRAGFAA